MGKKSDGNAPNNSQGKSQGKSKETKVFPKSAKGVTRHLKECARKFRKGRTTEIDPQACKDYERITGKTFKI